MVLLADGLGENEDEAISAALNFLQATFADINSNLRLALNHSPPNYSDILQQATTAGQAALTAQNKSTQVSEAPVSSSQPASLPSSVPTTRVLTTTNETIPSAAQDANDILAEAASIQSAALDVTNDVKVTGAVTGTSNVTNCKTVK